MRDRRPWGALAVVLLALAAAPPATAQEVPAEIAERPTTDVTFYGHVFGFGRAAPMPMNTEFPVGEADLSGGVTGDGCGVDPTGASTPASCDDSPGDEVWLYTTAGFVDATSRFDFSYENTHNERGLTKDFVLDTTRPIKATFYMSADMHPWLFLVSDPNGQAVPADPEDLPWVPPTWNWDPGTLPKWQVQATLYAAVLGEYGGQANTAPDVGAALNASSDFTILAQGISAPVDIVSLEAAGQPTVWQFDIDLGVAKQAVIPKERSLLVRFQWWSTALGGKHIVPEAMSWNVNSGEFYPPRITVPVKNAFDVELVVPQFIHDKLVILGLMNTPWGSYDVDPESVALTVTREDTRAEVEPTRIARLADFSVAHGGHYKPVNVTWVWDYKRDGLAPGTYVATVTAANHQHTAVGACAGRFTILPGGEPGPIALGECGVRTASERQIEAAAAAGGDVETGAEPVDALPLALPLAGLALVVRRRRA